MSFNRDFQGTIRGEPNMTQNEKKEIMREVVSVLKNRYPDAKCSLEYEGDAWKLLIMGRLSAQCTDERVNIVCRDLFRAFPTASDMANAHLKKSRKS